LPYFFKDDNLISLKDNSSVLGIKTSFKVIVGDVIKVFYSKKGFNFFFEGFCFIVRKKAFLLPDTSLHLINKIGNAIISFTFSFFYNLIFSFEKIDFKKSKNRFRGSKVTKYKQNKIFD
jgi:hypothetical protein